MSFMESAKNGLSKVKDQIAKHRGQLLGFGIGVGSILAFAGIMSKLSSEMDNEYLDYEGDVIEIDEPEVETVEVTETEE